MVSVLVSAIDADEGLYIYGTSSADEEDGELTVTMTQDDRGNRFLPVYTSCKVSFDINAGGLEKEDESSGEKLKAAGSRASALETRQLYTDSLVKYVLEQSDLTGMEINPDGNRCRLSRELLWKVFEKRESKQDDQEFYNRMSILYYAAEHTAQAPDMIRWQFGNQVAGLLDVYLRHMNLDEEVRHRQFISDLKKADTPVKVLALADVLVRQRDIVRSSRVYSGKIWNPDNPEQLSYVRYLSEVQDVVYDLQFNDVTKYAHWALD